MLDEAFWHSGWIDPEWNLSWLIFLRGCGSASSTPQNIPNEHLNTTKDTPDGSTVTWFWTHPQVLKKCGTTKPPSFLSWSVGETHAAWIRWNMGMARNFSQRHAELQVFNKSRYGAETQCWRFPCVEAKILGPSSNFEEFPSASTVDFPFKISLWWLDGPIQRQVEGMAAICQKFYGDTAPPLGQI